MTAFFNRDSVGTADVVPVTVDGAPVEAVAGQTVAGVLLGRGRDAWRTTRGGCRPRGVFCGIGACFDCLVVVNGTPDVRACQRTVSAGDSIESQNGAVLPCGAGESAAGETVSAEVVVVGAGPAGMAAALAAADDGASVVLLDTGRSLGGQFHRSAAAEFGVRRKAFAGDRVLSHELITYLPESSVWAVEGTRLWVQRGAADARGRSVFAVDGQVVVLATGAYDRVLPFPGWDLPGVYTAGAAQALAKSQRVAVGRRVVIAGTGPFLLPVAESLVGVGAEVVGLFEANRLSTVARGWTTDPLVAVGKLGELAGYARTLAQHRIRLRHGWTVVEAHGDSHVEAVTVVRLDARWQPVPGTERRIECDAVCVGFGFTPQLELPVAAGCELTDDGLAVVADADQQTTTPGVFAAGEITGIGGAGLSAAEGRIAGAAAARHAGAARGKSLGAPPVGAAGVAARRSRGGSEVERLRRFAVALGLAYPVRDGWKAWSFPSTLVCRCEEVRRGEVEAAAGRGVAGRALRLSSRVGLGLCQGRVCSRNVAELLGDKTSMKRPIAVPVRLGDLAEAEETL
ncbi:FAD-dependent oxidoreductase [Kribbella sp. NPDC058245]|uniref:FAD-dependent oxidoreductase n=1 Tax=Kribbella sp. NPDC058245 TaxID=3346399 RepID=UPI0036E7CBD5